jgi:hypothetical protein
VSLGTIIRKRGGGADACDASVPRADMGDMHMNGERCAEHPEAAPRWVAGRSCRRLKEHWAHNLEGSGRKILLSRLTRVMLPKV